MIYYGGMSGNNHPGLSRRAFLATAGSGGALLLGSARMNEAGEKVDPRIAQVTSRTIGIDMHNHVYPAGTEPHPQRGQPQREEEQSQAPDLFIADELKMSGLTAVCASFVLDFAQNEKPGDARDNFLSWLTAIDAQLEKGHIRRALNLKDLQAAHKHGQPTVVQTVEGAHFIEGHLERVAEVYQRGLRDLQLLHERDDMVSPLGHEHGPRASGWLDGFWRRGCEGVQPVGNLGGPRSRQSRDGAGRIEGGDAAVHYFAHESRQPDRRQPQNGGNDEAAIDQQRTREGRG